MIVADIDDDDAARHAGKQLPQEIGDGLRRDRKDDDFCGFGGVDNGSGRRAELGRQRGQALRSSRARNRDVMAEPGEVRASIPPMLPAPMTPILTSTPILLWACLNFCRCARMPSQAGG